MISIGQYDKMNGFIGGRFLAIRQSSTPFQRQRSQDIRTSAEFFTGGPDIFNSLHVAGC